MTPAVRALALFVPVVFVRCAFPVTVCVDRGTPGPRPGHISPRILCLARSCLRCRRPLCASSWRGSALHPPLEVSGRPRAPAILVYSAELLGAALHCIRPSSSQGDQPHRRRLRAGVIRSDPLPMLAPSPSGTKPGRRVQGGARRDPIRVSIWMSSAQLLRGRWSSTWPLRAARMGSAGPAGLQGGGGCVCRGMLLSRCALHLGPVPGRGVNEGEGEGSDDPSGHPCRC